MSANRLRSREPSAACLGQRMNDESSRQLTEISYALVVLRHVLRKSGPSKLTGTVSLPDDFE